jgi:hypothetical protein
MGRQKGIGWDVHIQLDRRRRLPLSYHRIFAGNPIKLPWREDVEGAFLSLFPTC